MKTYGGSEFDKNDFLLFGKNIKEFTYNTYLDIAFENDESPGYRENVKEVLRQYKLHIKEELLDSYMKKSKFNELNDMVVKAAKSEGYQEVASSGSDELYDFTGLTEKILKKIGISYVLTQDELDSIRALLESSSSRTPSRTSSRSSRGTTKKKKKAIKEKKKKKPTKKKKKPTKKKKKNFTKGRKRTLKKRGGRPENIEVKLSYGEKLGVDFYVSSENKLCEVKSVIAGGKAASSGVEPGHHLIYLNDIDVRSLTQAEIHHLEKRNTEGYWSRPTDKFVFGLDQIKSMDQNCPDPLILKQNTNTKTEEEIIENMVKFLNISPSKNYTDWISWEESFAHDTGGVSDEDKARRLQEKWTDLWNDAKKYAEEQALIREKSSEYYSGKDTIQTFIPEGGSFGLDESVSVHSPASSLPSSPS